MSILFIPPGCCLLVLFSHCVLLDSDVVMFQEGFCRPYGVRVSEASERVESSESSRKSQRCCLLYDTVLYSIADVAAVAIAVLFYYLAYYFCRNRSIRKKHAMYSPPFVPAGV